MASNVCNNELNPELKPESTKQFAAEPGYRTLDSAVPC